MQEKRKSLMKLLMRGIALCLLLSVLVGASSAEVLAFGKKDSTASTAAKTREINIVFDDSGSMGEGTKWSQARYALEVFAAMMGENDTINVYPMSNYASPFTLKGSDAVSVNIAKIEAMTTSGGTPFGAVMAAGDAMMQSVADERWLVVLTDGEFNDYDATNVLNYVGQNNTKVVYVGMGGSATDLREYAREMFYPYQTSETNILGVMTEMAAQVFNYQTVTLRGVGTGTVSFDADVPLSRVIVFAQGDNVAVGELSVNGSRLQGGADTNVTVKVERGVGDFTGVLVAPGLNGTINTATATDCDKPFADGTYTFDCNVSNVQVFVEPGVSVEAVLQNTAGETINIEDPDLAEIPEGDWTVSVRMINPLTGQPVNPGLSEILAGSRMDVVVTDDQGNINVYNDGETLSVTGDQIEIYGRATFQGISGEIEKTSDVHTVKVVKSRLYIAFSEPGGYSLDAVMLRPDNEMSFSVSVNGAALTKEQSNAIKFKVEDTNGIAWEVQSVDDAGSFMLVPAYASKRKGLAKVTGGQTQLSITAELKDGRDKREGEATVNLDISTTALTTLGLTLTMPDETIANEKQTHCYMFDASQTGVPTGNTGDEERPYILVAVEVIGADGTARPLTDEEWEDGLTGFRFEAEPMGQPFPYNLFAWKEALYYTAVKGSEPSTYKLYLDTNIPFPATATDIMPNSAELTVILSCKYDNGAELTGEAAGEVSVLPLFWMRYVIPWLIAVGLFVLAFIVTVLKLTRKRFPKKFRPWVETIGYSDYADCASARPREDLKVETKHKHALIKPQVMTIPIRGTGHAVTDTLHAGSLTIEATDRKGNFHIVEASAGFGIRASFGDLAIADWKAKTTQDKAKCNFKIRSTFTYENVKGRNAREHYKITLHFNQRTR